MPLNKEKSITLLDRADTINSNIISPIIKRGQQQFYLRKDFSPKTGGSYIYIYIYIYIYKGLMEFIGREGGNNFF